MMPVRTLVVVAKDQADLRAFDTTHIAGRCDLVLIANEARTPLSVIGNKYLTEARTPVLGLVHADCTFGPGAIEAFADCALGGSICGIVGRSMEGYYRWCSKPVGYRDGIVAGPGPVSTLDCCSVFLRTDLGLRFDERLCSGFHLHVEDVCLQASARKIPVVVPFADASHRGSTTNGPNWLRDYADYKAKFGVKWRGVEFHTT